MEVLNLDDAVADLIEEVAVVADDGWAPSKSRRKSSNHSVV